MFQFFIIYKRTNNANHATNYVKLGKKRREISKRNYYIISPREIIEAIIIMLKAIRSLCQGRNIEKGKNIGIVRGWELRKKGQKKIIPGTQSKARAGWPKRLRLLQATP